MRYSEAEKRVIYEPVALPQDFRTFDYLMPWEGPEYRLPGDEKATAQAAGAPSPTPGPNAPSGENPKTSAMTPKTTDTPAQTGGGKPADDQAMKEARKPRAAKAAKEVSKNGSSPAKAGVHSKKSDGAVAPPGPRPAPGNRKGDA
jgi:NADH-quinone oxidoreductase subunit C